MSSLGDVAAERACIAGLYHYSYDAYVELNGLITAKTFTLDSNQYIFKCLQHILENNNKAIPDLPSILSAANSLNFSEWSSQAAEIAHLRAVISFPVEFENVIYFAHKIKKLEIARQTIDVLKLAQEELSNVTGEESIDLLLSIPERKLSDYTTSLASMSAGGPKPLGDGLLEYVKFLASSPGSMIGISTGFKNYDRDIGHGLRFGTQIIGAFKKSGKSQTANAIALNISSQDIPVLFLDTEMSSSEMSNRALGSLSNVLVDDIENGNFSLNANKKRNVWEAVQKIEKLPYHYCSVVGMQFSEILSIIKRWLHKTVKINPETGMANKAAVVFDYLKVMSSADISKQQMEFQVLGHMVMDLNAIGIKFGVPILAFVQLNTEGGPAMSSRLAWFALSYTCLSVLSEDEKAEIPVGCPRWTHKLAVEFARFGKGSASDWTYMLGEYQYGRITEGCSRSEAIRLANNQGFDIE